MADTTNGAKSKKGLTKVEAVRQALAQLGNEAKPAEIRSLVKERFGIEMTTDHISNAKGDILRKAQGEPRAAKPAAAKPAAAKPTAAKAAPKPAAAAAQRPAARQVNGISLGDIATVQGLMDRNGADSLRKLIDLLDR